MNGQDDRSLVFQEGNQGMVPASTAAMAAVSREQAEIQAAIISAKRFPRDEQAAGAKVLTACKRPGFAEKARYVFPRAGKKITGPSIGFAREAARAWGNIQSGYRITDWTPDRTTVEGYALDTETNTRQAFSTTFRNLVQRRQQDGSTGWVRPDERDYRELLAKHGAVVQRNALLGLLPPDLVEDAMEQVSITIRAAARGELTESRDQTIRRLVSAFMELGVKQAELEAYLEHPMDTVTEDEIGDLRGVYRAISDGQMKREEIFPHQSPPAKAGQAVPADPLAALVAKQAAQAQPLPVQPETDPIPVSTTTPAPLSHPAPPPPTEAEFLEALKREEADQAKRDDAGQAKLPGVNSGRSKRTRE